MEHRKTHMWRRAHWKMHRLSSTAWRIAQHGPGDRHLQQKGAIFPESRQGGANRGCHCSFSPATWTWHKIAEVFLLFGTFKCTISQNMAFKSKNSTSVKKIFEKCRFHFATCISSYWRMSQIWCWRRRVSCHDGRVRTPRIDIDDDSKQIWLAGSHDVGWCHSWIILCRRWYHKSIVRWRHRRTVRSSVKVQYIYFRINKLIIYIW